MIRICFLLATVAAFVGQAGERLYNGIELPAAVAAEPFAVEAAKMPSIVVSEAFRPFVLKAVNDVADDLALVFGRRPEVVTNGMATANAIVLARGGTGWENYELASVSGNVLRITGSDDRGVMFGLYRFASDFLGVDPFRFWTGTEPKCSARKVWLDGISLRQGDPSFRFRGWFINDEDFLNGLRPDENGRRRIDYPRYHGCFGPFLADKLYESAVRAGFNLMVCASYVDILNPDERRLVELASSRGLYVTMHHQEPVGAGALQLDLHFPEMKDTTYASHPDLWRKAWRTYVREWSKVPDVIFQLGLRGRRDRPFWAVLKPNGSWADWGAEGEDEDRRRAGLISQAMDEQLAMIREAAAGRPFRTAVQLWMEGAEFYRKGFLKVPADTTVMFSDNCPGLKFQPDLGSVRRLPDDRPYGLYYHLAIVLGNHFCELVPPARTKAVLGDAQAKGVRELVLVNVSNLRPFCYTVSAAGEMLRNLTGFDPAEHRMRFLSYGLPPSAVPAAARALDLYFAAYETEPSRDGVSSYGASRDRAPLPILNDGVLCNVMGTLQGRLRDAPRARLVVSPYDADPDALRSVSGSMHDRVNQDMFPFLADESRNAVRASAQAASFARCLDQVEFAGKGLTEPQRRFLFERVGYPAGFLRAASACCAELALACAAHEVGNFDAARRHIAAALAEARQRDALDAQYNVGQWTHWYDNCVIYPYPKISAALEDLLKSYSWSLPKISGRKLTSPNE